MLFLPLQYKNKQTKGLKMTVNQAQEKLNAAYFAMEKNPGNKLLADTYWAARDALHAALTAQSK